MSNRGATAPKSGSTRRDLTSGNRRGYGLVRGWRPLCPPREDQYPQTTAIWGESITTDHARPPGDRSAPKHGGLIPVEAINPPRNRTVAHRNDHRAIGSVRAAPRPA